VPQQTIAMETYVRRSFNYLSRMVDADGLPYFNIFHTQPAEAAHDWPDFGDVTSRQLQAVIMARHMTGEELTVERIWREKLLSYLDPASGLLYRPATAFSQHVADAGDQALTLYALATAYLDNPQDPMRRAVTHLVDGMLESVEKAGLEQGFLGGFAIKSLMTCARLMGYKPALQLAARAVEAVFSEMQSGDGKAPLFMPDNTFRQGGHMHGNLRTLVGAADYALYVRDPVLYSRVDALYRYVRDRSTRFGFLPEQIGRGGDIVLCETCALMDYIGLATTLANHGHPEYWGDVERVARNHLIESQLVDGSWLTGDNSRADSAQFTWRDIGKRMVGGYAGWSAPNHFLAVHETLGAHWGGPELHDKPRAFQNCCGGSGTHAFFTVWKNAARFAGDCLNVNLHIDKLLPQAEIRGYQPYKGLLTIALKQTCRVRVRIPEFTSSAEMWAEANGRPVAIQEWGNYAELGVHTAGTQLMIGYPLPTFTEEVQIGNPGGRQYTYHVTWRGDTVLAVEPMGNDYTTGYSDFDKRDVPVFYGREGPGPLYQRSAMLTDGEPELSPLGMDQGALDLWYVPD
jgi:hypothetical protein